MCKVLTGLGGRKDSPRKGNIEYIATDRWEGWSWRGRIKWGGGKEGEGGTMGGAAKTNGHLRGLVCVCACVKSKLEPPNIGGDKTPPRHLWSSKKTSSAGNELYLIELLTKGASRKPPKQPKLLPRVDSPQTNGKASIGEDIISITL